MVVYEITCDRCHTFEGRFRSAADYALQLQQGLLACPVCSSVKLRQRLAPQPIMLPCTVEAVPTPGELGPWLQQLRDCLQVFEDAMAEPVAAPLTIDDTDDSFARPMGPDDICH